MEVNANIQLVMNSFGTLFPDMFQIPWHFQIYQAFQTSGHPVLDIAIPENFQKNVENATLQGKCKKKQTE